MSPYQKNKRGQRSPYKNKRGQRSPPKREKEKKIKKGKKRKKKKEKKGNRKKRRKRRRKKIGKGHCYYPLPHLCFKVAPCFSYRESHILSLSYTSGKFSL